MRTVTFRSVVDGVFALAGVTRTTAADPVALLNQVVSFVNLRLREAWEHEDWPELCPVERRAFRSYWTSAATYAAGAEIYFPGVSTLNVTGAGTAAFNGRYIEVLPDFWTLNGIEPSSGPGLYRVNETTFDMEIIDGDNRYTGAIAPGGMPWEAVWSTNGGLAPAPTLNKAEPIGAGYYRAKTPVSAGESPYTHPAKWERMTTFARTIALDQAGLTAIGEVFALYERDPRVSPRAAGRLRHQLCAEGVLADASAPDLVWVHFRSRPPAYSAANYENATPANFPVPYILDTFIRRAACADFLRMEAKFDEAGRLEAKAYQDLANASDAAGASQAQFTTARVQTY